MREYGYSYTAKGRHPQFKFERRCPEPEYGYSYVLPDNGGVGRVVQVADVAVVAASGAGE